MADQDSLNTAQQWLAEGRGVALVTVIETWGSAPVPGGSQLLVDAQTNFIGSVSGGCVETAVIGEAEEVLRTGQPRMLEYGVTNEMAWKEYLDAQRVAGTAERLPVGAQALCVVQEPGHP